MLSRKVSKLIFELKKILLHKIVQGSMSLFRRFNIPKSIKFRRFKSPKVQKSEGSNVRRFKSQKVQKSEGSKVRRFKSQKSEIVLK